MKDDKNIERFFKKRLESNEFSYQEKDWQNLEEKLDAAGIVPPADGLWLSTGKLLIAVLMVSSVAFFFGWFLRDHLAQPPAVAEKISGSANDAKTLLENEALSPNPPADADQTYLEIQATGSPTEVNELGAKPGAVLAETSENIEAPVNARSDSQESPLPTGFDVRPFRSIAEVNPTAGPFPLQQSAGRSILLSEETEKDADVEPEELSFRDRWFVGVSLAPDLNSIGLMEEKSVSPKFGGQIFFRLAEKWTISTGAYYNKKRYNTDGEKYSPPEGYWYYGTNGVKPSTVFGSCGVLDVPVKVYYRWREGKKFRIHSAVGLSNYFLLDEAYDFKFDQPNSGGQEGWYTEENSSVIAGVVNASVQISFPFAERCAFLAEPYIQAPLTKIGWGNVDLFSTGLLVTFRYKVFRTEIQPKHKNKSVTYHQTLKKP